MAIKSNKKRGTSTGGRRQSTATRVAYTAAAAAGGAVVGAVAGKLGLAAGLGLIVAGTMQNNPLLTAAGIAAAVAPGALSATEKSVTGGIKGQLEDARTSVKKLAANLLPKTGINIPFPNAFPSLQLAGTDDTSYYGPSAAEMAFNRELMSGTDDYDSVNMGRLAETAYQNMEVSGDANQGVSGFQEEAAQMGRGW